MTFLDELEESLSLGIELLLGRCLLIVFLFLDLLIDLAAEYHPIAIDTVSHALILPVGREQIRLSQLLHLTYLVARLILILLQALRLFLSFHFLQAELLTGFFELVFHGFSGRWLGEVLSKLTSLEIIPVDYGKVFVVALAVGCLLVD